MHQSRCRLRLAQKFLDKYFVCPVIALEYFDRNESVQLMVFSLIDIRHSAGTDAAQYLIPFP